jgi:HK97 family phage major capsid protein
MSKIANLYDKRNQLVNSTRAFLDERHDKNGVLSAEDETAYNKMESDIAALTKEIERESRFTEMENSLKQPVGSPITNTPQKPEMLKTGRASNEYKRDMLNALRSNFRQVSNVLEEGNDANGGYLVPEEYDSRLIDVLNEENILRKLGTTIKTSGEHKINIAGTKPAASWIEEGGSLVFSDTTFGQITLDAYKLHVAIKVTEELLYDSAFNLESYILTQFGHALSNAEEDAFLNGDGVGKPYGLFSADKGGQFHDTAGNSITGDDIMNLVYSLKRPYRKNASFIANDQTLASIRKLKDTSGQYLWQASYQAGEPDRLLGYAIHTSPYVPAPAAGQPLLAFGDYKYYNIGDRGTRSFAQLKELYAGQGMIGYLAKERVDGRLIQPEAVQILKQKGTTA